MPSDDGVVLDISCGHVATCFIFIAEGDSFDRRIYCFGSDEHGQMGGDGDRLLPTEVFADEHTALHVSVGPYAVCVVSTGLDRSVKCWGRLPVANQRFINAPIVTSLTRMFDDDLSHTGAQISIIPSRVTVGYEQMCVTDDIKASGTLFCRGWNTHGMLAARAAAGADTFIDRPLVVLPVGNDDTYSDAVYTYPQMTDSAMCTAAKIKGRSRNPRVVTVCSGSSARGLFGFANITSTTNSFVSVDASGEAGDMVSGYFLSLGADFACSINVDGDMAVRCWGSSVGGRLGVPQMSGRFELVPVSNGLVCEEASSSTLRPAVHATSTTATRAGAMTAPMRDGAVVMSTATVVVEDDESLINIIMGVIAASCCLLISLGAAYYLVGQRRASRVAAGAGGSGAMTTVRERNLSRKSAARASAHSRRSATARLSRGVSLSKLQHQSTQYAPVVHRQWIQNQQHQQQSLPPPQQYVAMGVSSVASMADYQPAPLPPVSNTGSYIPLTAAVRGGHDGYEQSPLSAPACASAIAPSEYARGPLPTVPAGRRPEKNWHRGHGDT